MIKKIAIFILASPVIQWLFRKIAGSIFDKDTADIVIDNVERFFSTKTVKVYIRLIFIAATTALILKLNTYPELIIMICVISLFAGLLGVWWTLFGEDD